MSNHAPRVVHVPRIAEVVAGDLRRRIVSGELMAGEALPLEADLVAQYGVSRPTLREAIRILESQSLISVKRGSRTGAIVQPPDIKVSALHAAIRMQLDGTTLSDVFDARIEIGVSAIRMLSAAAAPSAVERLGELHAREIALARESDDYPHAVSHFHAAIVELAGNQSLVLLRRILEEIVRAHERTVPARAQRWRAVSKSHDHGEHAEIIVLIASGNADAAEALWRRHLVRSASFVLEELGPDTVVDILGEDGLGP